MPDARFTKINPCLNIRDGNTGSVTKRAVPAAPKDKTVRERHISGDVEFAIFQHAAEHFEGALDNLRCEIGAIDNNGAVVQGLHAIVGAAGRLASASSSGSSVDSHSIAGFQAQFAHRAAVDGREIRIADARIRKRAKSRLIAMVRVVRPRMLPTQWCGPAPNDRMRFGLR